jgi:hypothetical protein
MRHMHKRVVFSFLDFIPASVAYLIAHRYNAALLTASPEYYYSFTVTQLPVIAIITLTLQRNSCDH